MRTTQKKPDDDSENMVDVTFTSREELIASAPGLDPETARQLRRIMRPVKRAPSGVGKKPRTGNRPDSRKPRNDKGKT